MMTADWGLGGKAVLLPPGGGRVFGITGDFKNNKEATSAARAAVDDAWRIGNPVPTASDAEGTPPECFWAGTLDGVHIVVLPLGALDARITPHRSCTQRAGFTTAPAWCLLDSVSMEAEYEAVAVAILRVDSFQRPAEHRERLRVGSALHDGYTVPVAQHMATTDALGTPIPFDVRVRDAAAAAVTLRDALVQAADAETDTHLSACLHKWADRVSAPDVELVPEELRQHAVSFDVQERAARPFVHRCPIPSTDPLPAPQLQQKIGDFDPQVLSDVLFEWAIKMIRKKLKVLAGIRRAHKRMGRETAPLTMAAQLSVAATCRASASSAAHRSLSRLDAIGGGRGSGEISEIPGSLSSSPSHTSVDAS